MSGARDRHIFESAFPARRESIMFDDCLQRELMVCTQIKGNWLGARAGGNPTHHTYIHNPHYAFQVEGPAIQLQATVQTPKSIPVNLKLIRQTADAHARIQQLVCEARRRQYLADSFACQIRDMRCTGRFRCLCIPDCEYQCYRSTDGTISIYTFHL